MERKKQVLLTGASGGLGSETVSLLCQKGWHVFAADIQKEVLSSFNQKENVTPVFIDVTDSNTITESYKIISSQSEGLDAVIHMAGILKIGSLAELPVSDLEKALDINLLGVYRINKQFLPLLKKQRGRIVIVSSEVGRQSAAPFNGIYSISKHALEAYADSLRRELAFLGIKVIKIQPGPFKTDMTKNAEELFREAQKKSILFKNNLAKGVSYLPRVYKHAQDPKHVASAILKALILPHPKTAYLIKADTSRMILDFLPAKWVDKLIKLALS